MRTVSIRLCDMERTCIPIGFVGENLYTRVRIDSKVVFDEYPTAIASLTVQDPNGAMYPGFISRDGDVIIWDVSASDLVYGGNGALQLAFFVDDVIAKSYICRTYVSKAMIGPGTIPTPIASWIDAANVVLGEAEEVVEALDNMTVAAETLAAGSTATAEISDVDGHKHIEFGIPQGDQGERGETGPAGRDGADGADGFSPTLVVTTITGGHRITITDKVGTQTVDVMDGEQGETGATGNGIASVVLNQDYTLTINYTNGQSTTTTSIRGEKGETGATGQTGATGATPIISIGTVTTGAPGSEASATMDTTDPEHPVLSMSIPEGEPGDATIDDTSTAADRVWSAQKVNELKNALASLAENGYYTEGTSNVYLSLESGMLGKSSSAPVDQLISSAGDTGYIFIQKANVPDKFYFDDTKYKANLVFINNNYEIASTYTSWDTTSPLEYTEPSEEWDTIGINVRKLNGNYQTGERSLALYKKAGGTFGNLATKDYVDNHKQDGHKCIYPDGFESRIKPDIYYDGKYYADIDPSDYIVSGTGEVWVATNGNDSTGDGTENNPYATITKALTVSAVTIHIKEGTYTQGTHYETNCYLGGKNIIGHGTVVFQNDSSGHYASASNGAYIENIVFKHGHATTGAAFSATCSATGKCICFVKCTFRDGGTNGLAVEGVDAVLFECVAYGNRYDGFNYHARTLNDVTYIPNVFEIDCVAYNNGTDQSGSDSCNGSTAHDGARVIRLNGEYYSCYGGVIAEIGLADEDPTISVNYGVLAHDSTGTGAYKASFWASVNTKMYLYDCSSYGGTYDVSAINDSQVVLYGFRTGRDTPAINVANTATVMGDILQNASGVSF